MSTAACATILVVDDSVEITRMLQSILRQQGYRVVVSSEPARCAALAQSESPDLVILDACMPTMDGWEVCRAIRDVSAVPILVLTVLAEKQYVERTYAVGADAHMCKPFSIAVLLDKVRDLLRQGIHRVDADLSEARQVE